MSRPKNTSENFWRKVKIGNDQECWLWLGSKDKDGYGQFWINWKPIRAHRAAYEFAVGQIPDGLHVLHNCPNGDNPACCNPNHLWLGTKFDNMMDRDSKKRQAKGMSHGRHKLTDNGVLEIRFKYDNCIITKTELGKQYAVSRTTIRRIVDCVNWQHLLE